MSDKKSKTRQRILDAARSALVQQGPADPSVSQVMGAAGLTVGGFYAHFDSKDELMLEAFSQLLAERRALLAQLDPALDGTERRALVAAFYLSRKHRDAEVQACPIPNALSEMQRLPDAFRDVLAEHIELMTAQMVDRPEDIDKALADFALMVGGLAVARALGDGELSDRILRAAKSAVI
ncbi:TetR/AcrR family transcriptional repressor of nem operon [Pseudomonas sp. TE6288]|uniref:TetR/AcrR family transcriptional regulator n=1 Tax=Pseudomonas soli TaxID=1306993 RepID=A0A2V4HAY6_9PSED|nr:MULTISPECIES: TetR/AcrR family transcriptional regulator [Pseudomonas]MBI6954820.1 TetR/AcrR family transcriptional regulator [Pseudomonas sp. CCOS 191]MDF9757916.1 AcrR family transcriptional regulator [Pseudomonas hunanensis]PMZ87902.1 TetR family transcriptional regulator [Pseudomonas sp. FW305-42]PNA19473.1 TetR family transcriptional regulator [Pseudomonas sp. MPR-R1B]PNB18165.1 TetR family transcriptional regulator [Pseudomonas sp. DP16D-E2]